MVEHGLWESLSTSGRTEIGRETEGFVDWQVGLDREQRSTGSLLFGDDVTSAAGEDTVNTTHGLLRHLDLDQEDGFEDSWLSKKGSSIHDTTSSRNDLTTTTVNGISVKSNIHDVETNGSHGLFRNRTFSGSPLETRDDGILDFVEILDGLGLVNDQVGTGSIRTKAPDLSCISDIPAEVISQDTGTGLKIITRADFAFFDSLRNFLTKGFGLDVEAVVLVG